MNEFKGASRPNESPARLETPDSRRLLDRILDTPHIAHAVPRLHPELLHRVILSCGLEDSADLLAFATPEQLSRIFDLDLWRTARPGRDEQFDADRFGVWLEVLVESGATAAARTLAELDVDFVIAGLGKHVRVFDRASVTPYETTDGEQVAPSHRLDNGLTCDVGGYAIVPRRIEASASWDAIVAVLLSLAAEHPDCFHQVMRGCRTLSNSGAEVDGLHDLLDHGDQVMFDLAFDRERRREKQGYATPAQARAFLESARQLRLRDGMMPTTENPVARAYFRALTETTTAASAWTDRDHASAPKSDADSAPRRLPAGSGAQSAPDDSADAAAAVVGIVDMLRGAGIAAQQPRGLLNGSEDHAPRLARIQAHMQFVFDRDAAAYANRNEELAYLANTLMAGCSVQARPFTAQEASDAAAAVCNLGLENWPRHWVPVTAPRDSVPGARAAAPQDDFLGIEHDLVTVFQVGWTVLHDDVTMYAAEQLIEVLAHVQCDDREIQAGLNALRVDMRKHWRAGAPWRARDALDVVASLDMPAWATLVALIGECPVIHAGMAASLGPRTLAVPASAFEFISENSQIGSVREFMQSLPHTLRP